MWNESDKFDHLISLAAAKCLEEEAKQLDEIDTSGVSFDDDYYRKKNRMIRKEKRKPFVKTAKVFLVRAAVLIMVLLTLACVLIGCVPSWRQAIYDAIFGWYEDYLTIRYDSPSGLERETESETETETETAVEAPTTIEAIRKPRDLPDDVWEDVVFQSISKHSIDYYIGKQYLFSFSQYILYPSDKYIDSEYTKVTYLDINGHSATVVEYVDNNEICIIWNDREYAYQIVSNTLSVDELVEYAKSVK